jgi:hypothetical protein
MRLEADRGMQRPVLRARAHGQAQLVHVLPTLNGKLRAFIVQKLVLWFNFCSCCINLILVHRRVLIFIKGLFIDYKIGMKHLI